MYYEKNEYIKYKLIRPLFGDFQYDKYHMPIMKKTKISDLNIENIEPLNIQSLNKHSITKNILIFPFNYDYVLERYWQNPLKYIPLLQKTMAVGTPDFSLYANMNINQIAFNVYRNRWLGCTWQYYGIKAIPTIGWANANTYDLCFSGIEKDSIVMISTIGCRKNKTLFLYGFHKMKKRLSPTLIIVYGKMIEGMTGTFINYNYEECFAKKNKKINIQQKLFSLSPIFSIKEDFTYGF